MKQYLGFLIIALAATTASAIRCYVCNSHNDTECMAITQGVKNKFLKDCNDLDDGHTYTLCRKIDMYMDMDFGEQHPAENRIHRACGYIKDEQQRNCYYKSGYNTRSWVCSCNTDDCNSSYTLAPFALAIMVCVGSSVLALLGSSTGV